MVDGDHARCLERVRELLAHPKTTRLNALRLVLLYALLFEGNGNNDLTGLVKLLHSKLFRMTGFLSHNNFVEKYILRYTGNSRRSNDLFGQTSTMETTKRFIKGLKGVENIYTQHEPYLKQLVESLIRGKQSDHAYPYASGDISSLRQDNIIIFIAGGTTFEESVYIRSMNEKRAQGSGGPALLLASTFVHITASFVEQLSNVGEAR